MKTLTTRLLDEGRRLVAAYFAALESDTDGGTRSSCDARDELMDFICRVGRLKPVPNPTKTPPLIRHIHRGVAVRIDDNFWIVSEDVNAWESGEEHWYDLACVPVAGVVDLVTGGAK